MSRQFPPLIACALLAATCCASSAHAAIDPCSLLTRQDVEAALGMPVIDAKRYDTFRPACRYTVASGTFTVQAFDDSSAAGAFETGKRMQDSRTEPVAGVGEQAYWSPSIETLNVLQGRVYFTLRVYGVPSASVPALGTLARVVVGRLPR